MPCMLTIMLALILSGLKRLASCLAKEYSCHSEYISACDLTVLNGQQKCRPQACSVEVVGVLNVQGNTQGRRASADHASTSDARMQASSPIGSPLGYTQPLESPRSLTGSHFALSGSTALDNHSYAGWPAQPRLIPTVIQCEPRVLHACFLSCLLTSNVLSFPLHNSLIKILNKGSLECALFKALLRQTMGDTLSWTVIGVTV